MKMLKTFKCHDSLGCKKALEILSPSLDLFQANCLGLQVPSHVMPGYFDETIAPFQAFILP